MIKKIGIKKLKTEEQEFYNDIINEHELNLSKILNKDENDCSSSRPQEFKDISNSCVQVLELFSGIGGMR